MADILAGTTLEDLEYSEEEEENSEEEISEVLSFISHDVSNLLIYSLQRGMQYTEGSVQY